MRNFLLLSLSLFFISTATAGTLDYKIENGKFRTSEGIIPDGCFAQLITELNGDNTVAAVFINRTGLRGCIAANIPYPGGDESAVSYEIVKELDDNKFNIKVCESVQGSMGTSCDNITIQFRNRSYKTPENFKTVVSVEKVGEWE